MPNRVVASLFCASLLVSGVAYSGQDNHDHHEKHAGHAHEKHDHNHGHEQHDAHVHGEARLMVAVDKNALAIELQSPAMNIVGFEHKPKNEAQKKAIQDAVAVLSQLADLFGLSAKAGCTVEEIEVDAPYAGEAHKGHKHHDHDDETHSEFAAHYHFKCNNIAMLKEIDVNLIKQFSGIQIIEVQLIAPSGQRKFELTANKNHIHL